MNFKNINVIEDKRSHCLSVSTLVTIEDYIIWYNNHGEKNILEEQRPVLTTRSANVIRQRLVDDLVNGAVIPPIVLGLSVEEDFSQNNEDEISRILKSNLSRASVIDGMQRTRAIKDAIIKNDEVKKNFVRIEFWLAKNASALIYRMLVLNTGQTPWNVKRQLEVVYQSILDDVQNNAKEVSFHKMNDKTKRTEGGTYPANQIIELFMGFTSRRVILDVQDRLSDDFTRLDVLSTISEENSTLHFFETLNLLGKFDKKISTLTNLSNSDGNNDSFKNGIDLFTQMPTKIGFIVAVARFVLGRPGSDNTVEKQNEKMENAKQKINEIINKIDRKFMDFDTLNEKYQSLDKKKIGNAQRNYCCNVFSEMLKMNIDEINNMGVIWMSCDE